MKISYKPLWKLLIDRDLKKKDLCLISGISSASVTKMGRSGHVSTETISKICDALHVTIDQILELVPDDHPADSD